MNEDKAMILTIFIICVYFLIGEILKPLSTISAMFWYWLAAVVFLIVCCCMWEKNKN